MPWTTAYAAYRSLTGRGWQSLERRIRLAYLEGAEGWSRETSGRGLTEGELDGIIARFP